MRTRKTMTVDTVLWAILAVAFLFLCCGCLLTSRPKEKPKLQDVIEEGRVDRAA